MSTQPAWQQTFAFFDRPIVVEPSHAALSSDAGLLPLRQFDERIALTQTFADALDDPRDPELTGPLRIMWVSCRAALVVVGGDFSTGG
jgi:hypothetical protein